MKNNGGNNVTLLDSRPSQAMESLYHEAFPVDERRPWPQLLERFEADSRFAVTLVVDDDRGREVGFITWWRFDGFVYIEHFATARDVRGCGIGAAALGLFAERLGPCPIVLEVEPPLESNPITVRRVGFYERCGFRLDTGFRYIQPPYAAGLHPVELRLMSTGPIDSQSVATQLHRHVYGVGGGSGSLKLPAGVMGVALALAGVLGACSGIAGSQADSRPVVVAFNEPIAALTSQVAGSGWEVVTLVPAGANPEMFDPTMAALRKVETSRLVVSGGVSEAEKSLLDRVLDHRGHDAPAVVDASTGIELITDTHGGAEADPHLWTSLLNLADMARNIAGGLAGADPANASAYRQRADSLGQYYLAMHDSLSAVLASGGDKSFVVNHPSLSYFARDYGIVQIALGRENKEQSARQLLQSIATVSTLHPRVMFVETVADSVKASEFASQTGVRLVVVPTNTSATLTAIVGIADALTTQ